jgi:hypothetical protein
LPFEQVQEFNYRLAQQREAVCCRLGRPHPSEDASRWETISEDSRARIRPAPALSGGVNERLGSAGGWFNLPEFKDWLLEPLGDLKLAEPRRQFQVFSVVRCQQSAVLDSPDQRDFWAAKVADFAQIHEAEHAGTPLGAPSTPCALLNRCHWAAVSSLGAAHLVADQGVPFDQQRVPTVRDKYFVPFLLAMLQAHYYEDTAAHLSERSLEKPEAFAQTCSDEELSQEWLGFLEFDGQCNHTYISEREAVNRWYALARAGLSVAAAHDRLSQLMRELDGFCRLRAAQESRDKLAATAKQAEQSVAAIKQTQQKVEWVEIFIIGVYSVYLIHYLGEDFHLTRLPGDYVGWWLLCGTLFASLIAALLLRPWIEHGSTSGPFYHDTVAPWWVRRTVSLLVPVLAGTLLAVYITVGLHRLDKIQRKEASKQNSAVETNTKQAD